MNLRIEKCKLRIANWVDGIHAARHRQRHAHPFFILHFTFCILQFLLTCIAACSLAAAGESTGPVHPSGGDYDRALLGEPNKIDANGTYRGSDDLEKNLKQQLGTAAQREDEPRQPLLDAAVGMRDAQTRLAQGKSDAITQHVQRQVVADLQKIIDEAKKSGTCLGQSCASR